MPTNAQRAARYEGSQTIIAHFMNELMRDIARYLSAVDTFRAEGCAPCYMTTKEER